MAGLSTGFKEMNQYEFKGTLPIKTKDGLTISDTFTRIVHGGRGAYVEFDLVKSIHVPDEQQWRHRSDKAFYIEYRTLDGVKVYLQKKPVDYADYKVGKYYISPIYLEGFEVVGKYDNNATRQHP